MRKYDVIPPDVKEYYNEQLEKHGIRMVPGHYPVLTTKEDIDKFIEITLYMREKAFAEGGRRNE